jgi:hypothetical protein
VKAKANWLGASVAPAELLDDGADVGQLDVAADELNNAGLLESSWIEMVAYVRCARYRGGQGGREKGRSGVTPAASGRTTSSCSFPRRSEMDMKQGFS